MADKTRKVSPRVETRIKRARRQAEQLKPTWKVALEFAKGNHYSFVDNENKLAQQAVQSDKRGGGKPRWRVRQSRNLIFPILDSKISMATQRVPGYQVLPSSVDPEDVSGAKLAERIAVAGYDRWQLRRATERAAYYAFVVGEAFALTYWDSNVGPFVNDPKNGGSVGLGDVRVKVYGAPEVSWEPGCQFEDSPYYVIEHARPISNVTREQGYIGGKLDANADVRIHGKSVEGSQMALITEYLERPTPETPNGLHLTTSKGRLLFEPAPYPARDAKGKVVDEPCLRRLSYMVDPDGDRDQGLVPQLVDPIRTLNDAMNKVSEWKNVALSPQLLAPVGSLDSRTRPSDEPGSIVLYNPISGAKPEFRDVPAIPNELFTLADRMQAMIGFIASSNDIPSQVESGVAIKTLLERDQMAWSNFLVKLAEWHTSVMRDALTLVQRHYTEPRLIQYRGRTGWESIPEFRGIDIRGQADVKVDPGSLEPRTRESVEQRIMNYAQMGWVEPEQAMVAIDNGTSEKLVSSYELDVSRANLVIRKIRTGEFVNEPPRPPFPGEEAEDPDTGEELEEIPGWMPRAGVDNTTIHKSIFQDWFKTDEWDNLDPDAKQASLIYYRALLDTESKEAARDEELQAQVAEQQGMQSASRPAGPKPQASLPAITPDR